MFRSSYLKVRRAEELLGEIQELLANNPPYKYILETNIQTNERATLAKTNEKALDGLVVRCGEVLHNLRSAIDNAYWDAVSPLVPENKKRSIQFPFASDGKKLDETLERCQTDKAGTRFCAAVKGIRPFEGEGGNKLLALIHKTNIVDKHRTITTTGNFTKINSELIKKQISDFPSGINLNDTYIGRAKKDLVWKSNSFNRDDIGDIVPPFMLLYHKDLNLPVETWITFTDPPYIEEVVTVMKKMIQETKRIVDSMKNALISTV